MARREPQALAPGERRRRTPRRRPPSRRRPTQLIQPARRREGRPDRGLPGEGPPPGRRLRVWPVWTRREAEALSRRWRARSGSLAGAVSGVGRPPNPAQRFMMPEAAPARRRRSARWPSEGEARPAGAMPGMAAMLLAGVRMFGSAPQAQSASAVRPPNFGFRIPDFKIENSVFESGVSSPVPGHARIRMRVSRRRRGGGSSRCAPGSSLDWGLQRLAGSGVWRLLCGLCGLAPGAQRRGQCPGAMADSARGRPDGKRERGRGRRWSGAGDFAVAASAQPQSRLAVF